MISPQNKRKELEHILNDENFVKITESIKVLRDETPFRGAIELLVEFYSKTDNSSVKRQITEFLNDLKDQPSCEEVIQELKKELKPETLRMLVSSCWQSGLNYSAYSPVFADLFLTGDYLTAIECFTVIESSVENLTRPEKDSLIELIRKGSSGNIGEKRALALELISVLE
ncbi:MAG TPA: hypothetical protein DEO60_05990 [Bacteroidales bacterium]|nr:hypothetical protein [Bacteroidales bacterium]HBZ20657.1 hypothetical protein [Bacteroidales bacterium]